jgi:hypothetical protein
LQRASLQQKLSTPQLTEACELARRTLRKKMYHGRRSGPPSATKRMELALPPPNARKRLQLNTPEQSPAKSPGSRRDLEAPEPSQQKRREELQEAVVASIDAERLVFEAIYNGDPDESKRVLPPDPDPEDEL